MELFAQELFLLSPSPHHSPTLPVSPSINTAFRNILIYFPSDRSTSGPRRLGISTSAGNEFVPAWQRPPDWTNFLLHPILRYLLIFYQAPKRLTRKPPKWFRHTDTHPPDGKLVCPFCAKNGPGVFGWEGWCVLKCQMSRKASSSSSSLRL